MTKIFRIFFYNEFGCKKIFEFFFNKGFWHFFSLLKNRVFWYFFSLLKNRVFWHFFSLCFTTKIFRIFLVRIFRCFWPKKNSCKFFFWRLKSECKKFVRPKTTIKWWKFFSHSKVTLQKKRLISKNGLRIAKNLS